MSILNGIAYKCGWKNSVVRIGAEFFRDSFEAGLGTSSVPGYSSVAGYANRSALRLGAEHRFSSGRLRPLVAIDIVAQNDRARVDGEGRPADVAWGVEILPYGYAYNAMRFGASASFGLHGRISRHFSCALEGGAWFVIVDDAAVPYSARSKVHVDVLRSFALCYTWPN